MTKQVGQINQRVIYLLKLNIESGTPIYLGDSNIKHMLLSHPDDYNKYKDKITDIINSPEYVGINPKDQSIEYVKTFSVENKSVKVAIRVSSSGVHFARTLYARDISKVDKFIQKGYLVKY